MQRVISGNKITFEKIIPQTGEWYRHYKKNVYEILNSATHTETEEKLVIYRKIGDNKVWARPENMFSELISIEGQIVPRFEKILNLS